MQYIVYLALIASATACVRYGPAQAFYRVYLPVLLLVPDAFRAITPGVPDPTFSQAAMLPIMLAGLPLIASRLRFSLTDALVFSYAALVAYSEFSNAGYNEAQNLMFDMLAWVVMPYVAARTLIEQEDMRFAVAQRIALLAALVSVIGLFEFRFGMNPFFTVLKPFFNGQGEGWLTTFRYGLARVAGPFAHCILAGIMLAVAYRFSRYLEWNNAWQWQPPFGLPGWLTPGRFISLLIIMGSITTIARGPWLGAIAGGVVTWLGNSQKRVRNAMIMLGVALAVGIPAAIQFIAYVSVGRAGAVTLSQESAAYRKELIDKYTDIALEHSLLGWGRNTWPKVDGMPSIDNHYLLIALMHGVLASALLLLIMLWLGARLWRQGIRSPAGTPDFSFTLLGCLLVYLVAITTVFMGEQTQPMFFLLAGWAESVLQRQGRSVQTASERAPAITANTALHFKRVL